MLALHNNSLKEPQLKILSSARSQVETSSKDVEINKLYGSKRARKRKVLRLDEFDFQLIFFYLVNQNKKSVTTITTYVLQVKINHKIYREVMSSRESIFWKYAINDGIDSIMSNNTWELDALPIESKTIGCNEYLGGSTKLKILSIPLMQGKWLKSIDKMKKWITLTHCTNNIN